MIQAAIHGRIGSDPVERTTKSGTAMATATVAVAVNRAGDADATEWFSLVAFGKVADTLLRHGKGDTIAAMGALQRTRWEKNGETCQGWSLTVEAIVSARTVRTPTRPASGSRPPATRAPRGNVGGHKRRMAADPRPFDDDLPL